MRMGQLASLWGDGGTVEADEAFISREPGKEKRRGDSHLAR